ncbi:snRNA-activating protein complex subunit 2 [Acipenser ruthenus]|uniref:snRNA-activating protein complex subunit 2 n=1 Tax=Acipenser ruthenus TaxID=7906 RepID=A0A662YLC7_ACIRT|nr:snRNA-activating protein complex subunit 2 [Acipenser ruthenus]
MKPPPRRRGVPERFSGSGVKPGAAPSGWTAWSRLEKKHLLEALKLQERRGEEELNTEEIQSTLPDRSNEQVRGEERRGEEELSTEEIQSTLPDRSQEQGPMRVKILTRQPMEVLILLWENPPIRKAGSVKAIGREQGCAL